MRKITLAGFAMAIALTAGCASTEQDAMAMDDANATAMSAEQTAEKAMTSANSANSAARSAQQTADQAMAQAKAAMKAANEANERAKRMLERSSQK
jgi:methyl-accepting chemotaxis protein